MRAFAFILIIALVGCTKVKDELIVTNTFPKPVQVMVNNQKVLTTLTPSESTSYFISGVNNIKFIKDNEVFLDHDVLVDGRTYFP